MSCKQPHLSSAVCFLKLLTNEELMLTFIEINSTNIPFKKEVKLLSITIDKKLKFHKYVIFYVTKVLKQIHVKF